MRTSWFGLADVVWAHPRAPLHMPVVWAHTRAPLRMPTQDIRLEAWIAIAAVGLIFSLFVLVPLGILIVQSPKLLRDRHYGLFALITFIWSLSLFTLGWMTIPMLIAIWTPYPTHP